MRNGREWFGPRIEPVTELMQREHRYRMVLAVADALAAMVTLALLPLALGAEPNHLALVSPLILVAVAKVQGLYDRDDRVVRKSTLGEWRTILQVAVVVSLAVAISWRLSRADHPESGLWLLLFLSGVTAGAMILGRTVGRTIAQAITPADRCLILGPVNCAEELLPVLSRLKGVEVVGRLPKLADGWTKEDLEKLVARHHAHRLVLVPESEVAGHGTIRIIRVAREIGVRISIFPTILTSIGRATTFDEIGGLTLLGVAPMGLSRSSRAVKRSFDVVIAASALCVLWPAMALIAVWIRLDSKGPALFRQTRIGENGRPFQMIKFRSMVLSADRARAQLRDQNEAAEGLFKIALDPRVTRAGRWLRKAHLDELPQFLNVLKGEMSLVGPRPLIEEEDALFCDGDRCRLLLTPGMTGPWQIRGPMAASLPEMAKLDYLYVSSWSLWRDLDILMKTVAVVLRLGGH